MMIAIISLRHSSNNKKSIENYVFLIIFCLLISGCISTSKPENHQRTQIIRPGLSETATATIERVSSKTVTPPITSTKTLNQTTSFATPTVVFNPISIPTEAKLKIECLELKKEYSDKIQSEGYLIEENRKIVEGVYSPGDYIVNMKTGDILQISQARENLVDFTVSTNKKNVAYQRVLFDESNKTIIEEQLIIAQSDGQIVKKLPWEKGWILISGWIDDLQLVLNIAGLNSDESKMKKAASLMVLNPFSGIRTVISPNYPDMYSFYPVPDWEGWGETVYDPTLSKVVYLGAESKRYTLFDRQSQKILANLHSLYFRQTPIWSPDGKEVVIAANPDTIDAFEIYSIDRDGKQITQLTHLTSFYSSTKIGKYRWSPNGRYIAFWMTGTTKEQVPKDFPQLAILDMNLGMVTNYCIFGSKNPDPSFLSAPVWSPQSNQIAIQTLISEKDSRILLIDIIENQIMEFSKDMAPVGWMK